MLGTYVLGVSPICPGYYPEELFINHSTCPRGNLWRELWETAKPVPAVRRTPLYDEDLAVDGILDFLEDISPSHLLRQLFIAALGAGLVIAEANLKFVKIVPRVQKLYRSELSNGYLG
ncbi:rab3 GTPase-activating catalytic subunit [Olea europaea subsp. europaea]|uniref:Rab3 GTPase-activating catalytic subunit n=1 Tax=Olea europaea subsp. europaea TaxID=158383 RepID=A0A8S0PFJ7_OLEEU|nr:rab3 GTPase-activating catalytic subunit [Olea europaea subsp. europaea]